MFIRPDAMYHEFAPQWLHWALALYNHTGYALPDWDAIDLYLYGA